METAPEDPDGAIHLGMALYRVGDYASCREFLEEAIASKDEEEPIELLFLAMAMEGMDDHEQAVTTFRKADEIDRESLPAFELRDVFRIRAEAAVVLGLE